MKINSTRRFFTKATLYRGKTEQVAITLLNRMVLENNDLDGFIRQALAISVEVMQADAALLLAIQPNKDYFIIQSVAGLEAERPEKIMIPGGNRSQAGFTIENLETVLAADLQQEKRFSLCAWEQNHHFASGLSVPILGKGSPYGLLILYSNQVKHFSQEQIPTLQSIAALLGFSLLRHQTAALEEQINQQEEQHKFLVGKLRQEIREREQTEQELSEREIILRSLFESSPDATILVDPQGKIVRANGRVEVTFGYKADELINHSVEMLLPEQLRSRHIFERAQYNQAPHRRPMGSGLELFARRKDGKEFPVDIMLSPVETQAGLQTLAAIRDASERKQIEMELAEVQRRLIDSTEAERLYLAQELHDGPIQDLYGVSFELSGLKDELQAQEITPQLQAATQTLKEVISVLRVICGDLRPPTLAQYGLEKSIRSHAEGLAAMHPDIKFQLGLAADGQLLPERVRLALFRIYQHAISNVIRHAEAHNVMISLSIDAENVILEIKDDGKGFVLPARWIELAREDHLGLVGTAERAQAINARLTIETEPGRGTCISVNLPRNQDQALQHNLGSPYRIIRTRQ